jgi:hypothetical protein
MTNTLKIVLWESFTIFSTVAALMGIAVSLLLIFNPRLMARVNRAASGWISTRRMVHFLDRSVRIERWLYRHHRLLGILIMLGAGYIIAYFGLLFDKATALQRLSAYAPARLMDILLDTLSFSLLLGAAVALVVGFVTCLRPSLLRGIEEFSNQWISLRRTTRALDIPRNQVDNYVAQHAQWIGWLLLLGSIYLFFVMFRWLL